MISGLALLIAAVAPAADSQITWHNVTLGAPASTLRAKLGDPLRIVPIKDDRVARYWLPGADSTYLLIIEHNGYVVDFEAFTNTEPSGILDNVPPDPSGAHLGDTLENVKSRHPDFHQDVDEDGLPVLIGRISTTVGAEYAFKNGRLVSFFWRMPPTASQPAQPPLSLPAGDSVASAILNLQQNETDGVAWEYRYLAFHPCADSARWQLKNQSLMQNGGRAYDRLHVVCPTTKAELDFYFDITSFYGKL
jgi:hypothetical protein